MNPLVCGTFSLKKLPTPERNFLRDSMQAYREQRYYHLHFVIPHGIKHRLALLACILKSNFIIISFVPSFNSQAIEI